MDLPATSGFVGALCSLGYNQAKDMLHTGWSEGLTFDTQWRLLAETSWQAIHALISLKKSEKDTESQRN